MATRIYASYEKAAEDYLALWRALRQEPPEASKEIARGAGYIRADTLIESVNEIATVSSSVVRLARSRAAYVRASHKWV
ncbi:MAG: hypothetical protein ACXV5I_07050 [Halobacteriota archaeon]